MSSNREQLDKWVEAALIVAHAEGMDDATVISTWPEDLVEALPGLYPSLTVGAVRAIAQQSQTNDDASKTSSASKNFYGLNTGYFNKKLGLILRDMAEYTPTELARALGRLAMTASSTTMREAEFNIGKSAPAHLADEPKYIDSISDTDNSAISVSGPDSVKPVVHIFPADLADLKRMDASAEVYSSPKGGCHMDHTIPLFEHPPAKPNNAVEYWRQRALAAEDLAKGLRANSES